MSTVEISELLRPGLLQGVSIVLAGTPADAGAGGALGSAVSAACIQLGARVFECPLDADRLAAGELDSEHAAQQAVDRALAQVGGVHLLVIDGASLFAQVAETAPEAGRAALRACLDASWNVTRVVACRAFLPGESDRTAGALAADGMGGVGGAERARATGGRIVYLVPARDLGASSPAPSPAPSPEGEGEHVEAACAGLENLARTLSIEWARHEVTAVAIAPGAVGVAEAEAAAEVAVLTAYLASPAGAYFSGCLLDLGGRIASQA
ncbi:MAG TPA: hypothetical protein VK272_03810 [Solirubrobacteraceae bacterium]|nr:hypothetical protein [Solirubrobacteraceae bacterium]